MGRQLSFREIVRLLNHSRTTEIDPSPIRSKEGSWAVYSGTHSVHTSSYPFNVMYIQSGATLPDLRVAAGLATQYETVHVVCSSTRIPQSFDLEEEFKDSEGIWTPKEYLVSFMKDEIQTYLSKLEDQVPEFYIDPRVETPSGFARKVPNPVLSFLREREGSNFGGGRLAVLLAEPGQGKTYMSQHLVTKILELDKDLVPLIVNSSQWDTIPLEDQRDLNKTILHSLRHFGATIGWIDGHEEEFLYTTMAADVFRVVFDGFDEYVLKNRGTVQALDVLEALAALANVTKSGVVITSRTSFWETSLLDSEVDNFVKRTGSLIYKILPFDLEYARNYFKARLKEQALIDLASEVYRELQEVSEDLAGRGFVLSLIADLVERSEGANLLAVKKPNPLLWLMEALCEREEIRQTLPFTAREQIEILRNVATEMALGETADSELLELSMGVVKPSLDSETLLTSLEKFRTHPLLEKAKTKDRWRFTHEQIWVALIAHEVIRLSEDEVRAFVSKARIDVAARHDLGSKIVDLVKRREGNRNLAVARLRQLVFVLAGSHAPDADLLPRGGGAGKLAAILALTAVEAFLPKGSTREERTKLLLNLCGGVSISGLSFAGTIARFDFTGVLFEHCSFEHVTWANCTFDKLTKFQKSKFDGLAAPAYCKGFGSVQLVDCRLDPEAEAVVNSARAKEGSKAFSVDDLRNDIQYILGKFVAKRGTTLRTVDDSYLSKGQINASPNKDIVIEELIKNLFEIHQLPGHSKIEYTIRKSAVEPVKFYLSNNVFTGDLKKAFDNLKDRLRLS